MAEQCGEKLLVGGENIKHSLSVAAWIWGETACSSPVLVSLRGPWQKPSLRVMAGHADSFADHKHSASKAEKRLSLHAVLSRLAGDYSTTVWTFHTFRYRAINTADGG